MRLDLGLRMAARGRTFSPAAIFAAGAGGAWYDPSDIGTLFQDSAGSVPVTAAGQTVGRMLDKSGIGNHATQATAANRPLFQESGGVRWLEFDGVNDALTVTFGTALSQPNAAWIAFRPLFPVPAAANVLLIDGRSTDKRNLLFVPSGSSWLVQTASTPNLGGASQTIAPGTDYVFSHLFNAASSQIRRDADTVTSGNNGSEPADGLTLGARFSFANHAAIRFHGLVFAAGNQEAAFGGSVRTWLAAKQGRTL